MSGGEENEKEKADEESKKELQRCKDLLRLREKEIDSLKNEQDHKKQVQVLENKIK